MCRVEARAEREVGSTFSELIFNLRASEGRARPGNPNPSPDPRPNPSPNPNPDPNPDPARRRRVAVLWQGRAGSRLGAGLYGEWSKLELEALCERLQWPRATRRHGASGARRALF